MKFPFTEYEYIMWNVLFTDYSFITGFIFYNYNPYNETMYQEAIEEDNNVLNMDLSGMYNIEGRIESDNNFFNLVMKYFDDFQSLNRDAYDSCRESAVHNVVPLDQSERDRMYKYCTGEEEQYVGIK